MNQLIGTKALWSLITVTLMIKLMVVTASNADLAASAADNDRRDWGCVAAAAEYQHFGDVNLVPMSLNEGEISLHLPTVTSLGLVSPGAATDGCHPIFSLKNMTTFFSHRL